MTEPICLKCENSLTVDYVNGIREIVCYWKGCPRKASKTIVEKCTGFEESFLNIKERLKP